ncbi:hypothetical protein Taro_043239 [Colocasia esculenta]|uniref:DUF4283 domain-containing protein n=1 Tax=Colocasia esculenta TaxID=4460 RepID=A0A843WRK6_COLES|nr:hypothetical protein [Colocasia esculenta]
MELDSLKSVPIWVAFHGLPLHLWTKEFIAKIASVLGKPLYLDKLTADRKRLAYARACFMISSEMDLPDFAHYEELDGAIKRIQVSYQWRPKRCTICSSFGHIDGACKPLVKKMQQVYKPKPNQSIAMTKTQMSNSFAALETEEDEQDVSESQPKLGWESGSRGFHRSCYT